MILYAHLELYYYEVHMDMAARAISFVLRYRDGHERRPTRVAWDDLEVFEQDHLLPIIKKAVERHDKNCS